MVLVIAILIIALLLALLVALKLKRDTIYQDGRRAGSALCAEVVRTGMQRVRFVIVRGEPQFRPDEPFLHQGHRFLLGPAEGYDDSSTVLRRWIRVVCDLVE